MRPQGQRLTDDMLTGRSVCPLTLISQLHKHKLHQCESKTSSKFLIYFFLIGDKVIISIFGVKCSSCVKKELLYKTRLQAEFNHMYFHLNQRVPVCSIMHSYITIAIERGRINTVTMKTVQVYAHSLPCFYEESASL